MGVLQPMSRGREKPIIDDYLRLRIADLKRLGLLPQRGKTARGVVSWERGTTAAKITVGVTYPQDGEPSMAFAYTYDGELRAYKVELEFAPSNLSSKYGYYYFVCPKTGERCRNLYLVNGYFVSRKAFSPLYWTQAMSRRQRSMEQLCDLIMYKDIARQELEPSRYRRITYKGKLTPYGRKVARINAKLDAMGARCEKASGTNPITRYF